MKKIITFIPFAILLLSCGQSKNLQLDKEMSVDELFIAWNKMTYNSIESQAKSSTGFRKEDYEKNLKLFKVQHDIIDFDKINASSIRYKFLEKLSNQYLKISNYFIIEADISGEYYQPRIFVMYSRNKRSTDVMKFEYRNYQWEFIDSFLLPYEFNYRHKDYIKNNGKDWNRHNVVVTHVINNTVERSDFFLISSMNKFVFELPESANHF